MKGEITYLFKTKLDDLKYDIFTQICVRNLNINNSPLPYLYSGIVSWGSFSPFNILHLSLVS